LQTADPNTAPQQWHWPEEPAAELELFHAILEKAELERKGVVVARPDRAGAGNNAVQICFPLFAGDRRLAAAYAIRPTNDDQLRRAMRQLQWGIVWLEKYFFHHDPTQSPEADTSLTDRLVRVFDLLNGTLEKKRCRDAAAFLTTELATLLRCDRVTAGLLERGRMKILALSHSAAPRHKSNIILSITTVLEEAADQRETLVFPPGEHAPPVIVRAHGEHAGQYECTSLLTVPFCDRQGSAYGAMLFERSEKEPFQEADILLAEAVASLAAPVLRDKDDNDLPLWRTVKERGRQHLETVWGPEYPGRKAAALGLLCILLFLAIAKGDFLIPAPITLSGEIQRAVVAPFSGYVGDAHHSAGDHVAAEEPLASLDTSDLTLDQLQWASRKRQADLEYQKAMADNLTADAQIILEQKKQAEIQLALLDLQKKRTTITAPFAGLLVKGDLSQSIGAPVERGQVLFEIVPDNASRVLLDVDERDIGFIAVGQDGTLVFNALPRQHLAFTIEKITPVSTAVSGHNTFRVEGRLRTLTPRLRPGMQGYAKIYAGSKPLGWIWSRPLLDRLRLWFWSRSW
jgi:biotin carboxyl carrier protein